MKRAGALLALLFFEFAYANSVEATKESIKLEHNITMIDKRELKIKEKNKLIEKEEMLNIYNLNFLENLNKETRGDYGSTTN